MKPKYILFFFQNIVKKEKYKCKSFKAYHKDALSYWVQEIKKKEGVLIIFVLFIVS